jgi:hypothetical protein
MALLNHNNACFLLKLIVLVAGLLLSQFPGTVMALAKDSSHADYHFLFGLVFLRILP